MTEILQMFFERLIPSLKGSMTFIRETPDIYCVCAYLIVAFIMVIVLFIISKSDLDRLQ